MALNKAQYDSIIKGYEETREHNRYVLENRRQYVYEEVPGFEELEQSVASISVAKAKLMLNGDDTALSDLHSSLSDIAQKKKLLLRSAGLPEDYLEPIYNCPDCKDTGYIESPEGAKEKCHCFLQQEFALLYEQSNIQEMIATENFSTLSYKYYQGEDLARFKKCVEICENFVQNFDQNYSNLFFYGTVGTGKSFLSGCIANELLKSGHSVIYYSSVGLFTTLARYSFDKNSKEPLYNFYKDLYNCDLMIIDDLGTEITNGFISSELFACLNERHLNRKATIISTNLGLEELRDRYSDRVFSRITSNYTLCKLTGSDIRLQKKRAANLSAE